MADTEQRQRYTSTTGINRDSLPWRLWTKSKKLFWDPDDIDFTQDKIDFDGLSDELRFGLALGCRGFMVGEEAVTLDILPLLRAISAEGRLEETIFLTSFALEEAKHVDFFRSWFDAVGFDPSTVDVPLNGTPGNGDSGYSGGAADIFGGELERVMGRLETDPCPEAFLDAGITYNQFIEGVAAIAGYKGFNAFFGMIDGKLQGLQEGLKLVQRDERRHIAYGTFLCRRIIAAHPETWEFVEMRWEELTRPFIEARKAMGGKGRYTQALIDRRLQVMSTARGKSVHEIEGGSLDELESTNDLETATA